MIFAHSAGVLLSRCTRTLLTCCLAGLAGTCPAQIFSERAITVVVQAPAGGTTDLAARALQEPLSRALGVPVLIENRGGGNGAVGAQAVLAARPDGHALLMAVSGFHTITPHLVRLPYDPLVDFKPVAGVISAPQVLVVRSTLEGVRTSQDLLMLARTQPGRLNYASTGNGSMQHITAELFKSGTGTFITHIPYRGTGQMVQDLLGGDVDLTFTTAPPLLPHIQAGKLRPLLVTAPRRLPSLPDVPTAREAGLRDFEVGTWLALFTHAQAPDAAVARITEEVRRITATAAFRAKAAELGAEAAYLDPAQLAALAAAEHQRWGRVIRSARIRAD